MGHAIHFLQRIERLSPAQADLALTLYRGPELVAHVLGSILLPEGAERVALALEDRPAGPHVIVTRDGRFVTCLGPGMSVNDCPVISRAQIDFASERIEVLRVTLAQRGETRRLWEQLLDRGSGLPREDFLALAELMPIFGRECIATALEVGRFVVKMRQNYRRHWYRKITPLVREELHLYWTAQWAVGHLVALCGERTDDLRAQCMRGEDDYRAFMQGMVSMAQFCMSTPILMRGAWTAARAGRALLPWLRQQLQESRTRADVLMHGLPLMAVGLRHRRAHAEVSKALASQRRKLQGPERDPEHEQMEKLLVDLELLMGPEHQELRGRDHRAFGASMYAAFTERLPADSPMRITRPEDVPEDLALTVLMNFDGDLYGNNEDIWRTLTVLPWLSRASGADLYLPAKFFESCGPLFSAEATLQQLDSYYRYYRLDQPARAKERPGRNEPCACGSGKKYKRCCGATA
ncbi:MAG TPA: SEC-C metal-binding domain-containing protein [Haliangium sp.]|nr:SEC-C metal-binding domain-containing protein [Haliangium sp.]